MKYEVMLRIGKKISPATICCQMVKIRMNRRLIKTHFWTKVEWRKNHRSIQFLFKWKIQKSYVYFLRSLVSNHREELDILSDSEINLHKDIWHSHVSYEIIGSAEMDLENDINLKYEKQIRTVRSRNRVNSLDHVLHNHNFSLYLHGKKIFVHRWCNITPSM